MILIVNADDAGIDAARNRGILRAVREGIVRSASLLVTFPAAEDFVDRSRGVSGLGVGLHLNLTGGKPLVPGHRSLVGEDGVFLDKHEVWRRSVGGLLDEREVRREVEAQWECMERLGVHPTHLDGHNHVHLFPGVREAVVATIPGGTWVRLARTGAVAGRPPDNLPADLFTRPDVLAEALGLLGSRAHFQAWESFRTATRFEGLRLPSGYGSRHLRSLLDSLDRDGGASDRVEIMTHPGEVCDTSVPYSASPDRQREVEALTSPEIFAFVRERGVRLANFGELGPCA